MARKLIGPAVLPLLVLGLYLLFGCAATGTSNPYAGQNLTRPVWLVTPGWHSGLVLHRKDIPPGQVPESADFEGANYLEFGWGDRDYYRARDPGPWLALKAALIPGPSVLYLAGFRESPEVYFASDEILRIDLPDPAFRRVIAYLHDSFTRHGAARAGPLDPRGYSSGFYEAEGQFHLFNNCNVWTARALQAAGLPLVPFRAVTAGNLRCQAERWGRIESGQ